MEQQDAKNSKKKIALICTAAFLAVIAIAIGSFTVYYSERWHPGSSVNDISLAGMTYEESVIYMEDLLTSYSLEILGRNDGAIYIGGDEIELTADFRELLQPLYEQQRDSFFLSSYFNKLQAEIDITISYSEELLSEALEQSVFLTLDPAYDIDAPTDAAVIYSEDDLHFVIVAEDIGNTLQPELLVSYVADAIQHLEASIDLTDEERYPDIYIAPEFTSESEEITDLYYKANSYLLNWIEWDMDQGVTEVLEPDTILEWLTLENEEHTVTLDEDAFSTWLTEFCQKYKTVEGTRNFTTHSGKTIEISGGDYGWRIDYDAEKARILELLNNDTDRSLLDAYIESPTDETQEALYTSLEPEYSHTAYRKDYDNPMQDWDTENYSEVDLSEQMVYVYKDGQLAFSCRCVTGKPDDDSTTSRTPKGVWFIKEKKEEKTLVGDDYRTDTKYWVRITWSGVGYHYMNRSDWGKWSPTLYQTKGSHGCVNLELENSKTLYDLVTFNDAVFIY